MTPSTVRLKQLAEAATPGPWDDYYETGIRPCVMAYDENDKGLRSIRAFIADTQFAPDRAFIASANPQAVLGLIARIEKLEAALQFYANEKIYDAYDNHGYGDISEATDDYGLKAREALKEEA